MSHDLDETTGTPAMAYIGERPWHRLGKKLLPGESIDIWVEAARLNWEIEMLPVAYRIDGKDMLMPERFVLARSDTHAALSIVSPDYLVVQPKEVLEFYRDLVEQHQYQLETAGALDGGRKVWALARTGLVAKLGDQADEIGAYVLLATSCDKTLATTVAFTSVRVVCQNTLRFAMHDIKNEKRRNLKINHNDRFDAQNVKHSLGLLDESWTEFKKQLDRLVQTELSRVDADKFFLEIFQSEADKKKGQISKRKKGEILQVLGLYHSAPGQELATAKDTLWGAVNAITYYVDRIKKTSGDRMDSAWFGSGATLKEKAWELALAWSQK